MNIYFRLWTNSSVRVWDALRWGRKILAVRSVGGGGCRETQSLRESKDTRIPKKIPKSCSVKRFSENLPLLSSSRSFAGFSDRGRDCETTMYHMYLKTYMSRYVKICQDFWTFRDGPSRLPALGFPGFLTVFSTTARCWASPSQPGTHHLRPRTPCPLCKILQENLLFVQES